MSSDKQAIIIDRYLQAFLDSLWLESGLSNNTIAAYQRDLLTFSAWLRQSDIDLVAASRNDILRYQTVRMREEKCVAKHVYCQV